MLDHLVQIISVAVLGSNKVLILNSINGHNTVDLLIGQQEVMHTLELVCSSKKYALFSCQRVQQI